MACNEHTGRNFYPKPAIAKNYHPVSLFSVISEVFENLANNRLVDHLKKCGIFSHFQYGFRSSGSCI